MTKSAPTIAAVVVTFNRLALLQECIAALRAQTRPPDEIIVVDNSSTDGTGPWLDAQPDLTVVRQPNLGSSGGQQTGIRTAFEKGHDWFWCMDDDTIPDADALECMVRTPYFNRDDTGFLCSYLLWTDRTPHPMHAVHCAPAVHWCGTVLSDHCIRVTMHTFVSLLVARRAVAAVGLPVKEFFLIVDDYEFTDRISQQFAGWCVLDSLVAHKTKDAATSAEIWGANVIKESYRIRNEVSWTLRRRSFTRFQKFQYLLTLWTNYLVRVLRREIHPRLLLSYLGGFFFRYRIERV